MMRVLLSTFGSRGDVQPFVALAKALQAIGAQPLVCAPTETEFNDLLDRNGVPHLPAFSSVRDWVAAAKQLRLGLSELAARMITSHYATLASVEDCDAVIATGLFPSAAAAQALAESRGIPYVFVALYPFLLPSPHHPPMSYPGWPNPPELTDNKALWRFNARAMNALFGDAVNAHRARIGLPMLEDVRDPIFTRRPWVASDPVLAPWNPNALTDAQNVGAWILADDRPLDPKLEAFLRAGDPPVYVGFGSMRMVGVEDVASIAISAVRAQGRRVILAHGWADLNPVDERNDCLMIGEVNHQALFKRVAAVVHHGGAGTTTTAAHAGAPQVIVPQSADQPYWAARMAQLGICAPHDGALPKLESLSAALQYALFDEVRRRALEISRKVSSGGAATAAKRLVRDFGK